MDSSYVIDTTLQTHLMTVIWKSDLDEEKNNKGKKAIRPLVNAAKVYELSQTMTSKEFFDSDWDLQSIEDFEHKDKITYSSKNILGFNGFVLSFYVKEKFKNSFYIPRENANVSLVTSFANQSREDLEGIFYNSELRFLNLEGLQEEDEIKSFIESKVSKIINSKYVLNVEYKIDGLNEKIESLKLVQSSDTNFLNKTYLKLVLTDLGRAKNLKGSKTFYVINTIDNILNKDSKLDLSTINIPDFEVSGNDVNTIAKNITNHINKTFNNKFLVGPDLEIVDMLSKIESMIVNKPQAIEFTLIGKNNLVTNSTKFRASLNENSKAKAFINLNNLFFLPVKTSLTEPEEIKKAITKNVEKKLGSFNLIKNIDYTIEKINDLKHLTNLVKVKNSNNIAVFPILAKSNKTNGSTSIRIDNYIGEYDYKQDQDWMDHNPKEKEEQIKSKKSFLEENTAHLGWIVPLILFRFPLTLFFGLKLIRKIKARRIK